MLIADQNATTFYGETTDELELHQRRMREMYAFLLSLILVVRGEPYFLIKPKLKSPFPLPTAGRVSLWEAEEAKKRGRWDLRRSPLASGGAYVKAGKRNAVLEFVFKATEKTSLKVWPVWWIHGERKPPRQFPWPLELRVGPESLVISHKRLFFSAPAVGRVGVLDCETERSLGTIEVGGFVSDLEEAGGKIFVCNAEGDEVLIIDPRRLTVIKRLKVPACPWAIARTRGMIYVICKKGKALIVINPEKEEVVKVVNLPLSPVHVAEVNGKVVVWLSPIIFDPYTMKSISPDAEFYPKKGKKFADFRYPWEPGRYRRFWSPKPHMVKMRALRAPEKWEEKDIDVSKVTKGPRILKEFEPPFVDNPGPDKFLRFEHAIYGSPLEDLVFFTSPSTGRVGIINAREERLWKVLDIGGYLTDIVHDFGPQRIHNTPNVPEPLRSPRGKVYVADALGKRVVVIKCELEKRGKPKEPKVPIFIVRDVRLEGEIKMPGEPWALEALWDCGLFVVCREENAIVKVDVNKDEVVKVMKLPFSPDYLSLSPVRGGAVTERMSIERRARIAVCFSPLAFDPATMELLSSAPVGPEFRRAKRTVDYKGKGSWKTFWVASPHCLGVTEKAPNKRQGILDLSHITDWQFLPNAQPLSVYDQPGSISISVDDGPEFPWMRGIWITPDQGLFLIRGLRKEWDEEFWRWNACWFMVGPGEHVIKVKAHSPFVRLDALAVERTLEGMMRLTIEGMAKGAYPRYQVVFYDNEPVKFRVKVRNLLKSLERVSLDISVEDYMGKEVWSQKREFVLRGGEEKAEELLLSLKTWGTHTLRLVLRSARGQMIREKKFLRLPKLERSRMIARKADIERTKEVVKEHPILYKNWAKWLINGCKKPPKEFLPGGTFINDVPGLRRYRLAWNAVCALLGSLFLENLSEEQKEFLRSKVLETMRDGEVRGYGCYDAWHNWGPFFPGAETALFDLLSATQKSEEEQKLLAKWEEFLKRNYGRMYQYFYTIGALSDPPTERDRAVLFWLMMHKVNIERYAQAHCGKRGGSWWLAPRHVCFCETTGHGYYLFYLRNLFGERRLLEKPFVKGFLTYHYLSLPYLDKKGLLSHQIQWPGGFWIHGKRGPTGSGWLLGVFSKHPLSLAEYNWDEVFHKLSERELSLEELDRLLRHPNGVVPLALALGWFDPKWSKVRVEELPPTVLFDVEGVCLMRSDWGPEATEIYFSCGARDHVYHEFPSHFHILKAGELLIGTAAPYARGDGCPSGPRGSWSSTGNAWGNVVVIEPSEWRRRWGENFWHPRSEELAIINRFYQVEPQYRAREARLVGFHLYDGWMGYHGHSHSLFLKEGEVMAYETRPQFDYIAGDATNAWSPQLAEEVYRQLVFVKPDIVVVYDRLRLGPEAKRHYWVACVAPRVHVKGRNFYIKAENAFLTAKVLFPKRFKFEVLDAISPKYDDVFTHRDPLLLAQKVLEVHPKKSGRKGEYLVVMRVNMAQERVLVQRGEDWRFTVDYIESEPPKDAKGRAWFEPDYDDSGWRVGKAPIGYGDEDRAKYGTNLHGSYKLGFVFLRKRFKLEETLPKEAKVVLKVASDESAKVYINRILVDEDPMFGKYPGHEFSYWNRVVEVPTEVLKIGENVIVVHVFNVKKSSDLYFDLELTVEIERMPRLKMKSILDNRRAGVKMKVNGKLIRVRFNRQGIPGGDILIKGKEGKFFQKFVEGIDDSYRHWQGHPMFERWMAEERFSFIIPKEDKEWFAKTKER